MATYSVQGIPHTGLVATYNTAAGGGDKVPTGSNVFLDFRNGHSTTQSVTLVTPGTVDSLAVSDRTVAVVAGGQGTKIPVPDLYRDPADGLCSLTYSGVTSLTFSVESI